MSNEKTCALWLVIAVVFALLVNMYAEQRGYERGYEEGYLAAQDLQDPPVYERPAGTWGASRKRWSDE